MTRVLTLGQIEILYPLYQDKRMHYSHNSVNLGSCEESSYRDYLMLIFAVGGIYLLPEELSYKSDGDVRRK